ncbi:MAG: nitroreductase family protein [Bifidobacteriaceae bacterium]|jgi:nitroreductase|nr:nitroreductase family protein [Bifidobacteriaceae bacterium]
MSQHPTPADFDSRAHARQMVLDAFRFRRAIKAFDPSRTIAPADVDYLLEAARLSPTSHGLEPFRLLVIEDRKVRLDLVERAGGVAAQMVDASHLFALTAMTSAAVMPDSDFVRHMELDIKEMPPTAFAEWQVRFRGFLTSRYGVWGNDRAIFDWAGRQAYIVLGNIMTAAALVGIDSCALEGMVYSEADAVLTEAGAIDPDNERLAVMVALGYRLEEPRRPMTRRSLGEMVQRI